MEAGYFSPTRRHSRLTGAYTALRLRLRKPPDVSLTDIFGKSRHSSHHFNAQESETSSTSHQIPVTSPSHPSDVTASIPTSARPFTDRPGLVLRVEDTGLI